MRSRAPLVLALLSLVLPTCGGGGGSPAAPAPVATPDPRPETPQASVPVNGATTDGPTPELRVRNARGFDSGEAVYDFVVTDAGGQIAAEMLAVPAGAGETTTVVNHALRPGLLYRWKVTARANSGGRTTESSTSSFEVGFACQTTTDPYAKAYTDFFVDNCSSRRNRLLDPNTALGPPDARGLTDASYRNFVSLGEGGHIVLDMGGCFADGPGDDLRIFQYIEYEPVVVRVATSANGPWYDLGKKPCGEGGTGDTSGHCDFDLAPTGLRAARYVWVEDGELFPCSQATSRTEGADIDAVEILHFKTPSPSPSPAASPSAAFRW